MEGLQREPIRIGENRRTDHFRRRDRQVRKGVAMDRYYTLPELYETKDIDESYLKVFNNLHEKAKARVLEKNIYLNAYLNKPRETAYDSLDFNQERINVECVFLRHILHAMKCSEGHGLVRKSVTVRIDGRIKGVFLLACPKCKRFYSEMTEDIEKLESIGIPYYIVEEETDDDEK
jgi:hypothetical protein